MIFQLLLCHPHNVEPTLQFSESVKQEWNKVMELVKEIHRTVCTNLVLVIIITLELCVCWYYRQPVTLVN